MNAISCVNINDENQNTTFFDSFYQKLETMQSGKDKNEIAIKYEENTKTTLKKVSVQTINNDKINKLETSGDYGESYIVSRTVKITKNEFVKNKKGILNNAAKLYDHSVNYMDDLGGYYSFKTEGHFDLNFKIIKGERVMLRTNQVHPKLKNGSLGIIEDIIHDGNSVTSIMVNFDDLDEHIGIKVIQFKHPEISEIVVKAFPLIPAFAITIHKLQGQTIKSPLFINYNDIPYKQKQYHLLYTAISRCKDPNNVYIIYIYAPRSRIWRRAA